jgi:hypothetical protein
MTEAEQEALERVVFNRTAMRLREEWCEEKRPVGDISLGVLIRQEINHALKPTERRKFMNTLDRSYLIERVESRLRMKMKKYIED